MGCLQESRRLYPVSASRNHHEKPYRDQTTGLICVAIPLTTGNAAKAHPEGKPASAAEWGELGIQANAIGPGYMLTDMQDEDKKRCD
ncbi:hypothetical protein EFR84_13695 [Rhizobium chutanense]|uniref:Uncharacterized protein n=1 Tax=Rhizobium chutanense TaxID=2035448 RepID=A0A3S0QL05_9HYPH|nr:hypothetical protein EFR84_13695 [Rhizobium chutanense]